MANYIGLKCPVCGKPFVEGDDIVVCPQCGAPYHRDCYLQKGECIFRDRHGTPDAWSARKQQDTETPQEAERTKRCPRCGYANSEKALFCEHCGQPLMDPSGNIWGNPFGAQRPGDVPQGGYPPPPGYMNGYPGGPGPFPFDPTAGIGSDEQIDGIPVGDVAKFVQNNTQYYLPTFLGLNRMGKNRFNFCAFLLPGAWMLYRKLYKVGAAVTSAMFLIYIAYIYIIQQYLSPLYNALLLQTGITPDNFSPSSDQIEKLMNLISTLPRQQMFLLAVPSVVFIVQLAIMLVCGFNANKMYFRRCVGRIGSIKSQAGTPADTAIRMQQEGGVNMPLAVCIGICYLVLFYLPNMIL